MSTYNTEQRTLLIEFLKRHSDTAFSAEDSACGIKEEFEGNIPAKSTVYRLLPKLLHEGKVKRFEKSDSRQLLYQIVDGHNCDKHLHLKCVGCGKLLHMSDTASDAVLNDVLLSNHFAIDKEKTVLFGMCSQCERDREKGK